jgi:hypothetical protein
MNITGGRKPQEGGKEGGSGKDNTVAKGGMRERGKGNLEQRSTKSAPSIIDNGYLTIR